jgi:RimJ/RimL family protein N-acetyltransferase
MILVDATPAHFNELLAGAAWVAGYRVPPGGVADPAVLEILRGVSVHLAAQHDRGSYMMVVDGRVVGLCGYKAAPVAGEVEIGYGVAAVCRRQGFATQSLSLLLERAIGDPAVSLVIAHTVPDNHASRRVLERNGFALSGEVHDPDDGPVLRWIRPLQTGP